MLHTYQVVATVVLALIFLNVANNLHILSELEPRLGLPSPLPLVSALVPARNEEANIGPCLRSLLSQDYPRLEVLVLDDDSRDRTAEMVVELAQGDSRLRLLRGAPLPQGWHGKAYACQELAEASHGEYLLFADADTVHSPEAVSWAVRLAREKGADLLTVFPRLVNETFWEKVVVPLMHFGILSYLPLELVERTSNPWLSMALGPFMFFRRAFYEEMGGHGSVKGDIAEDVALGRLVKKRGGRLVVADGTDIVRVRFYHNWGEVWRGFSKSAFAALGYSLGAVLGLVSLNLLLFLFPFYFLCLGLVRGHGGVDYAAFPLIQILLGWGIRLMLSLGFRQSLRFSFLHPLTVVVGLGVVLNSARLSIFGTGTTWKGRTYSLEEGYLLHRHPE